MSGLIITFAVSVVVVQPHTDETKPPEEFAGLSAREIVREGNRRLAEGDAISALTAYDHADQLRPDAREIEYARGLAQFDLKDYDQAREAFSRAAATANDALAADAHYGLAACDHVEALDNSDDTERAMSLLESAMRRYHHVLDEQPNHEAALDANYKAASVWRRMKEMQQQQPPPQESDQNDENKDDEKEGDEENQQQPSDENQDEEDQQQSSSENESEDQQPKKEEQQQSAEEKKKQVSREQAERQLREMMQALRQREKARKEAVMTIPLAPVDKDW